MKTYQDLLKIGDSDTERMGFVRSVIEDYKLSDTYKNAVVAKEYDMKKNRTILEFTKKLYTLSGGTIPDAFSSDYKIVSGFFPRFINEQNQFLLSNGVSWLDPERVKAALGDDFDYKLQKIGRYSLVGGVGYGFFNVDHVEAYDATEFAPLKDERTSAIKAGVRFWQIDSTKPLHAMFFEMDGVTEYVWDADGARVYEPKRPYKIYTESTPIDGEETVDGDNYPSFPVVPLYGNLYHQSELIGIRSGIDCYDLIKSGFANDLEDASQIYWLIQDAGGMSEEDLALFMQRMKTTHVGLIEGDAASVSAHTMEVPYTAREAALERLSRDLYKDYMTFNSETIANGAVNIPQIKAAYELLNNKVDEYEYYVLEFVKGILELAGIEDEEPSFTRGMIANVSETAQIVLSGANYLDDEYITKKLLDLLGDGDKAEEMIAKIQEQNLQRLAAGMALQSLQAQAQAGTEAEVTPQVPVEQAVTEMVAPNG